MDSVTYLWTHSSSIHEMTPHFVYNFLCIFVPNLTFVPRMYKKEKTCPNPTIFHTSMLPTSSVGSLFADKFAKLENEGERDIIPGVSGQLADLDR